MAIFLIRRVIISIPVLLAVSFIVFFMVHMVPGDPVMLMLGPETNVTGSVIEQLREEMGFNEPLYIQYSRYMMKLLSGDMGNSIRSRRPVLEEIVIRIPNTVELALVSMGLAITFGIAMGIVCAVNHNKITDYVLSVISLLGVSLPNFWFGLLLMLFFGLYLRWVPVTSGPGTGFRGLILPAVTLALSIQTATARLTRSGMLEVMNNDYIRTARSKGVREWIVVIRHALRNSLISVLTVVGVQFGGIMAGTTIIETVFGRLGIGVLLINAILEKDMPIVQGVLLMISTVYISVNFVVEVIYVWLDPRIRLI